MYAVSRAEEELDQHVFLHDMTWKDYEILLAVRGESAVPRIYYLDGEIELMSPSHFHEERKKTLARLLETWAIETDVELNGFGSWTLKSEPKEAGAEPDECYVLGALGSKEVPDMAIEVEWSRKGMRKHEIYRRLGVRELWTVKKDGGLLVRVLVRGQWVEQTKSRLLPKLDLKWLLSFLDMESQSRAVRALRDELRDRP